MQSARDIQQQIQDELQQQTIDQLKELYPVLKQVIEKLNKDKKWAV